MPFSSKDGAAVAPAVRAPAARTAVPVAPPPRQRPANPLTQGELGAAMAAISKTHGPAVLTRGDMRPMFKHVPSGIFALDIAMLGGLPEGAATLGYGWEHSGKTTMGLKFLAQAQRKYPHGSPALLDIEGTYSPAWGAIQGIDNERLALAQPESGEQALDIAIALVKAQEVTAIMIDSLAALAPRAMLDKSFEDATVGEQARMISRFCVVLQSELIRQRNRGHRVAIYLVNQWRTKIGVMRGDPRVLPGGVAQNYLASIKIDFKNKEEAGRDEAGHHQIDHNDHAFTIKKNKIGVAPREGEFMMVRNPEHPLGQGFIDDARAVITWAKSVGYVGGGGQKQTLRGVDKSFRTLQDMADHLYDDREFFEHLKQQLIEDYRESKGLVRNYL
jgi:recombination protein RecA